MKRETFLKRKEKISRRDGVKNLDAHRITVFRSNKYFYASIIENKSGNVLHSVCSRDLAEKASVPSDNIKSLARKLCSGFDFSILKTINFDRGVYRYHGLVKVFVEEVRNSGVKI